MCGPYDGSDIALHCDARLRVGSEVDVFVRNSFMSGGWGGQETHSPNFPFMPNDSFDMIILAEKDKFKVIIIYSVIFATCNFRPSSLANSFAMS